MSIFKKKEYKRSPWYSGFLACEELVKEGFVPEDCKVMLKFKHPIETVSYGYYYDDCRMNGIKDYIQYKQDVLEKL